jgi:enterochelin esterase family protein
MSLTIHPVLLAPTPEAIRHFVEKHQFPLVEGPSVTFVWQGEADQVNLRHWIYGLPSSQALTRFPGSDVWWLIVEIPPNSRVEYKLEVLRGDKRELITDPRNPLHARDPFGANSVVHGLGYATPAWLTPDPDARKGTIDDLWVDSAVFGDKRRLLLYLPARFRKSRRYPLLFVHDGLDYLQYTGMRSILDNLIHRLEIPELVCVFANSPDRLREYAADPRHARFVTEEVVPLIESRLPLLGTPAGRCLMGASFGAIASLATAFATPGFYGRLLLQSGSFAFTDIGKTNHRGPLFDPIVAFMNEFRRKGQVVSEKLFVSCGQYESLIYENRSLVPLLQASGMEVRYVEARDGHNWENWRDRLREGLSFLFPGPLWLVYE